MGRYFVGVEVPAAICGDALIGIEQRLDPHLSVKRWYTPDVLHITTHFLGELSDEQIQQVISLVTPHTQQATSFDLQLGTVGWFPQAKVVWCGVVGDTESLCSLQQTVAMDLAAVGAGRFAHDMYRPHITLGRLHATDRSFRPESVDVADLLSGPDGQGVTWRVDALHLFESVSGPAGSGPTYPIRCTFPLKS